MRVINVHQRVIDSPPAVVGSLIDTLASADDRLWPRYAWPAMRLDRALGVGAIGGHGPVRYRVESYVPGRSIRFRFLGPRGFDGFHAFHAVPIDARRTQLRHTLQMNAHGVARLSWPLLYRPLHDALVEDAFTCAQKSLGLSAAENDWSAIVRCLRRMILG